MMEDVLGYRLGDFLLFSPEVYFHLFANLNSDWPFIVMGAFIGGVIASGLAIARGYRFNRLVPLLLALVWFWVLYGFIWQYYRSINWAIIYLGPLFCVQIGLFLLASLRPFPLRFGWRGDFSSYCALGMVLVAFAVYPLLGLFEGRSLIEGEVFGSAADPTAIGSLGILLFARGTWRWILLVLPVIWCLLAATSLWTMDQNFAFVPLVAAFVAVLCGWIDLKNGTTSRRVRKSQLAN